MNVTQMMKIETNMKILKNTLFIILIILALDFIGLCIWIYSGQHPQDNFFLGTISYHLLQLAFN